MESQNLLLNRPASPRCTARVRGSMTALRTPPIVSERPHPVEADDFHRLGLPLQEARSEVIRMGVHHASQPWIKRTRIAHNSQHEQKLARILIAGYRAIDPRRRIRLAERLSLSLQDPNSPLMAVAPWLIHPADDSGQRIREQFDSDRILPPLAITSRDWHPNSQLNSRNRRVLIAATVLIALLCSLAAVVSKRRVNEPAKPDSAQPSTATQLASTAPARSAAPIASKPTNNAVRPEASLTVPMASPFSRLDESKISAPGSSITPDLAETTVEIWSPKSNIEFSSPSFGEVPWLSDIPMLDDSPTTEAEFVEGIEPDIFPFLIPSLIEPLAIEPTAPTSEPPTGLPSQTVNDTNDDSTVAMPDEEQIKIARQRLLELEAGQPAVASDTLRRLQQLNESTVAGSADRYVVLEAMLVTYILGNQFGEALLAVDSIAEQFGIERSKPATASAVRAAERAASLTEAERATEWALRAVEMAIREQQFDSAQRAVKAAGDVVVKSGSNDLKLRVRQVRDVITSVSRAKVGVPDGATVDQVDIKTATQVGRYLCLFVHDWTQGLPWLARSQDTRIAKAAEADLAGRSSDAADAYLDISKSQRGRSGETMLMRAIELLRVVESQAVGLEAEQIKRRIIELTTQLPVDLRTITSSVPSAMPLVPPMAIDPSTKGLLGRLRISGSNAGALVRYQNQNAIDIGLNVLDQIFAALKVPKGETELEFAGFMTVPTATTVNLKVLGPQAPNGSMSVTVNGQQVQLQATGAGYIGKVDLPAGIHRIHWVVRAKVPTACALSAENDRDASRLDLHHNAQVVATLSAGDKNLLPVSVISN